MSIKFVEPNPIKAELIQELDGLVKDLSHLTIRKPKTWKQATMHAQLDDFLQLSEQDFIRGWTDCEEGIQHKEGQSEAYNAGYADCYEYENRGGQ